MYRLICKLFLWLLINDCDGYADILFNFMGLFPWAGSMSNDECGHAPVIINRAEEYAPEGL